MSRPPLRLLVVLGLLAAGLVAGALVPTPREQGAPAVGEGGVEEVGVVGAALVCPDLRQQPDAVRTTVAAGVLPPGAAERGPEPAADPPGPPVTVRVLGGEPSPGAATPLPVPSAAAVAVDLGTDADEAALEVRATGPAAAGLTVQQTAAVTAGAVRGLATAPCGPARSSSWLVGGGTRPGEASTLVLANPGADAAVVDVTVLTGEGPVDDRPGRGLSVPAHGRVAIPLDTLAPDRSRLAVHVQATDGRVAAALRHERSDGVVPAGVAYAGPVAAPQEQVDVPGLPAGPGGRQLWLANPGEAEVEAAVEVTTTDGQFVPDGLEALAVPAGSTLAVNLSSVLGATPATARVTATGPVLAAGAAEETGNGGVRDHTYVGAAPALPGPTLLPDVALGTAEHTLVLSALAGDAVVDVSLVPVAGAPPVGAAPRRVDVPGGRTVAVPLAGLLPEGATGRFAVLLAPDRRASPVHAGVVVRARPPEGALLTALALAPAPATVPRPRVVPDPAVGTGGR